MMRLGYEVMFVLDELIALNEDLDTTQDTSVLEKLFRFVFVATEFTKCASMERVYEKIVSLNYLFVKR